MAHHVIGHRPRQQTVQMFDEWDGASSSLVQQVNSHLKQMAGMGLRGGAP